jgi:hypothetical protein
MLNRRVATVLALCASVTCHAAEKEVGALLKSGEWRQGVGSHGVPLYFADLAPTKWPTDHWYALSVGDTSIEITTASIKGQRPAWLQKIVSQIPEGVTESPNPEENLNAEYDGIMYLRVPGTVLKEGRQALYVFKNGTGTLRPELDYQYHLSFNGVPFDMRVQNGLKGKNGEPYGEGATYFIDYAGKKFEYPLGYFGWASKIVAITDIDGDGLPDFVIDIDGSNSGATFILLSSHAKPGKNIATASLNFWGC